MLLRPLGCHKLVISLVTLLTPLVERVLCSFKMHCCRVQTWLHFWWLCSRTAKFEVTSIHVEATHFMANAMLLKEEDTAIPIVALSCNNSGPWQEPCFVLFQDALLPGLNLAALLVAVLTHSQVEVTSIYIEATYFMAIAMILKEEGTAIPIVALSLAIIQGFGKSLAVCFQSRIICLSHGLIHGLNCTLGWQSNSGTHLSIKFRKTYPASNSRQ